ncbi:hypothetical protein [Enterococcus sp. AZ072]|uniref:hypothetical protein n=1 Tax=unclassified Enterococcus TaxID=2608891 RepID=UPI003D2AEA47
MKITKIIAGLALSTAILGFTAQASAAELNETADGTTSVEITDYTIDPTTGLPSSPGAFAINQVPSIDFGQHSLDSVAATNASFQGTYDQDLEVKDARPTQGSITSALNTISGVTAGADVTQTEIDDSKAAWEGAVAASSWKVNAQATQLDNIGTSLKIGDVEVLTAEGTVVTENSGQTPVGTKAYSLADPVLTIANNNLNIQTYAGTITFTAISAE